MARAGPTPACPAGSRFPSGSRGATRRTAWPSTIRRTVRAEHSAAPRVGLVQSSDQRRKTPMHGIIYIIGLVVVVLAVINLIQ